MTIEIHQGSGNVYADLEFPDAEAMQAKAEFVTQLRKVIHSQHWSQKQASAVIGVTMAELVEVIRGRFRLYQVEDLASWLVRVRKENLIADV